MIGQTLGSYQITDKLGEGGMGVVYTALHPLIGRRVAIKFLLPELSNNAEIVNRFFNEARSSTLIKHPGIVDILDFGYHQSGSAYIVMEYLEGESLRSRLRHVGHMPEADVLRLSRQAAGALAAAHSKGIVHRDLKPDNLFLVPDQELAGGERVKILDFGIAKLSSESQGGSVKTRTGSVMGSPAYMSPEQCRGAGAVDERADVYSLGCVMYEMVCGRPPFVAEGVGEVIAMHIYEAPPPVRGFEPAVSEGMESIVMRTLMKKPEERIQTMAELVHALDATTSGRFATGPRMSAFHTPVAGVPSLMNSTLTPKAQTTLGAAAGEAAEAPFDDDIPGGAPKRGWILPTVGVVAVAAVAAVFFLRGKPAGTDTNPGKATPTQEVAKVPEVVPQLSAQAPAVAPPRGTETDKVTLKITSQPDGVDVYRKLDGLKLGTTPFEVKYEKAKAEAVFVLKQAGYRDEEISMALDMNREKEVRLKRAQSSPRPPEKHAPRRKEGDPLDPFAD
jgi:serine/threonine-protein kinase